MEQRKVKLIGLQRIMIKIFWITLFLYLGFICGTFTNENNTLSIIQLRTLVLSLYLLIIEIISSYSGSF